MLLSLTYNDFIKKLTKQKWELFLANRHAKYQENDDEYMLAFYYFEDKHTLDDYYFKHIDNLKDKIKQDIADLNALDFDHEKWKELTIERAHKSLREIANGFNT